MTSPIEPDHFSDVLAEVHTNLENKLHAAYHIIAAINEAHFEEYARDISTVEKFGLDADDFYVELRISGMPSEEILQNLSDGVSNTAVEDIYICDIRPCDTHENNIYIYLHTHEDVDALKWCHTLTIAKYEQAEEDANQLINNFVNQLDGLDIDSWKE